MRKSPSGTKVTKPIQLRRSSSASMARNRCNMQRRRGAALTETRTKALAPLRHSYMTVHRNTVCSSLACVSKSFCDSTRPRTETANKGMTRHPDMGSAYKMERPRSSSRTSSSTTCAFNTYHYDDTSGNRISKKSTPRTLQRRPSGGQILQ